MELKDLKIGMKLDGCFRELDYVDYLRVEYVAYDWAVARTNDGEPVMLCGNSNISEYKEVD